ncbi:small-conductance mechanosensitive channel [Paenibacillus eucommiae]|uniref:Small-conductance mechanosensitive channel n=1 Tax=Paenibacillus eucommiae TaxID=1355755 RepID=A0ABS4IPW3_9BACL|nr:small-conductance mechanosensitive channel [Paenibacillus eucommiae]
MNDYVGIIITLLLAFGVVFIRKSKRYAGNLTIRLIGYALILMSVFLIISVIMGYLAKASHGDGH